MNKGSGEVGLYIHIPFCRRKCIYCDFTVIDTGNKDKLPLFEEYMNCVGVEMSLRLSDCQKVRTVYIGGGTPSLIGLELLTKLVENLSKYVDIASLSEFTIEANPEDVTNDFAKVVEKLGINRVSLGIQSMSDGVLNFLSRRNTRSINERAIKILQDVGITNINCDVIFDVPSSTTADLVETLERLVRFNIPHISAYGLTIERFTPLSVFVEKGLVVPRDNFQEEFILVHRLLTENGFIHYEISNYAKEGFESKHNMMYWSKSEYVGLGLGACGFVGNRRYQNEISFKKYKEKVLGKMLPTMMEEEIDVVKSYEETVMLGIRKRDGFSVEDVRKLVGEERVRKFLQKVELFKGEYLKVFDGRVIPTLKGWIFSDYIVRELTSV